MLAALLGLAAPGDEALPKELIEGFSLARLAAVPAEIVVPALA